MKMGSDRLYREVICRLTMSEGKQTQVVLLDDYRLDILIKPKLYAGELLDMVASHFSLKEKEYFGLSYIDETGHHNWLQLERRVLEHEFPKKSSQSTLLLFFRVKYFVESITQLRDNSTVEAFYLQAQSLVYQGTVEVTSDQAFHLAALVLQAGHGDYISDESTKEHLKKLTVIPTSTLLKHPCLPMCEKEIIERHKALTGVSRGNAIVNYMQIVESLPAYGVHYYEVKDKAGIPWWLGISYKGICQYDLTDKKVPRKVFSWKQLENLYFRDRKFSIEVCDPKRPSTSRKAFGAGNISVYVWFAVNPSLTRCIWSMAIAQHQFYLDRKHKATHPISRNLSEIATELSHDNCRSNASTNSTTLSRSGSTHSLPALKINDSCNDLKAETVEMLVSLKARKETLEETLHKKCEELKRLCLQEGELTGILPHEMPLSPGEQIPLTRKRLGSDFSAKERLSWKKKSKEEEELAEVELEYEIQCKIVAASGKLATDPSNKKGIHRQRKISLQKAQAKLKELEKKLRSFKKKVEKLQKEQLKLCSDDEPSEDNLSQSTDEYELSHREESHNTTTTTTTVQSIVSAGSRSSLCDTPSPSPVTSVINSPSSAPSSPVKLRHHKCMHQNSVDKSKASNFMPKDKQGYTPSSVYQTKTAYRNIQYPTLPTRLPSSYSAGAVLEHCLKASAKKSDAGNRVLSMSSPYQNKFESTLNIDGSNLYSVPTQRTSQAFDTQDDLLTSLSNNDQDLGLVSRHNSLDRRKWRSSQKYRYIENKYYSVASNTSYYVDQLSCSQTSYGTNSVTSPTYDVHHPHFHHHQNTSAHPWTDDFGKSHMQDAQNRCQQKLSNCLACCKNLEKFTEGKNNQLHNECQIYQKEQSHIPDYSKNYNTNMLTDGKAYRYSKGHVNQALTLNSLSDNRTCITPNFNHVSISTPATPTTDFEIVKSQSETYQNTKARLENLSTISCSNSVDRKCYGMIPKSQSYYQKTVSQASSHTSANVEISVVRYGQIQPYWEETKPYEISDFYKYSRKHRKQPSPANENVRTTPSNFDVKADYLPGELKVPGNITAVENYSYPPSVNGSAIPVVRTRSPSSTFSDHTTSDNDGPNDKTKLLTSDFQRENHTEFYVKTEKVKKTTLV